jgi:glycosyltransferase involved in cell wall biosynthesis
MPKISFLVSTYNSEKYLDRCIRNLMQQTEQDFEIIIVNPNSQQKDGEIAEKWAEKDNRIKYIYVPYRENYGNSWIRAWKASSADYVANANTDDLRSCDFAKIMIERTNNAVFQYKKIGFTYSGLWVIDENDNIIGGGQRPPFDREVFEREDHAGPSFLWLNKIINEIDLKEAEYFANLYHSAWDYWLILKIISLGYDGLAIPEQLVYYRQRKDSIENSSGSKSTYQSLASISQFFPDALMRIAKRENNNYALDFKDWPYIPPQNEWVDAFSKKVEWNGEKINILEL